VSIRDRDKIIDSVIRWLLGLPPKWGRKRHYFESYKISERIKERLRRFKVDRKCPFCGKEFEKKRQIVSHIFNCHRIELRRMIEEILEE